MSALHVSLRLLASMLAAGVLLSSAPVAAQAPPSKRYALLVGVKAYDRNTLTDLKFPENDVERLHDLLATKDSGYRKEDIIVLTNTRGEKDAKASPTAENIRTHLKALSKKVNKRDTLLIALSGHGVLLPLWDPTTMQNKGEESFFCPKDAWPRSKKTMQELRESMIPLGELFRELDESGAGVRLMLVDACRNEHQGGDKSRNLDIDTLPKLSKGTAVLFSCKAQERAYETDKLKHGIFFYYVLEALAAKTKATRNEKGQVVWIKLVDYVTEKVEDKAPEYIGSGGKQTPHKIENIEGRPIVLERIEGVADAPKEDEAKIERLNKKVRLGLDYYLGRDRTVDYPRAKQLLREAADEEHPVAMAALAWMLYYGIGSEVKRTEGEKLARRSLIGLREAADKGDTVAQLRMGGFYSEGIAVTKDEEEAVRWYRLAAEAGEPAAMNNLGNMYLNGRGVTKDQETALRWYKKASSKDDPAAMFHMGIAYERGQFGKKDDDEALTWYRKAAEKGLPVAMVNYGAFLMDGRGVTKNASNREEGLKWLQKAAGLNETVAMLNLADAYRQGRGVAKSDADAASWFEKAAKRGDATGMVNLGVMLENGAGVARDRDAALMWYHKAAEVDDPVALFNVGLMYARGTGVKKDAARAADFYRKSAEKGFATAMLNLGGLYEHGTGVEKDETEALSWYRKAASKDNAAAMFNVGVFYEAGRGGKEKDEKTAFTWYLKSAEKGFDLAQFSVGECYELGFGTAKSLADARAWYRKAAAQGHAKAREKLQKLSEI